MGRTIKVTKEYLEANALKLKNDRLIERIIEFINPVPNMDVLDVGTGTGYFAQILRYNLKDPKIKGIDYNAELLAEAKNLQDGKYKNDKLAKIEFLHGDAYSMPFDNDKFDLVTSHNFLSFIIRPNVVIEEMYRVAKPNGIVLIAEPSFSDSFYQPQFSERMRELEKKATDAFARALEEEGLDRRVTPKIPQMMLDAGFINVTAIGHLIIELACEYDSLEKEVEYIKFLRDNDDQVNGILYRKMLEGGLLPEELEEFKDGMHKWWDKVIENPHVLDTCGEYREIKTVVFKGIKPAKA